MSPDSFTSFEEIFDNADDQYDDEDITFRNRSAFNCPSCQQPMRLGELACPACQAILVNAGKTEKLEKQNNIPTPKYAPAGEVLASEQQPIYLYINGLACTVYVATDVVVGRCDETGKEASPDIDLTPYGAKDRGVSRHHMRIRRRGILLYITDLGSTNGTILNGRALLPHTERILRDGDTLYLGHLQVQVRY